MRYMFLIYEDETIWERFTEQEKSTIWREVREFIQGLRASGVYRAGGPLEPTTTATTVRMKRGRAIVTDGPFAETKEQLAGYDIVEVGSHDEALAIAARHPGVRVGRHAVEVRPIMERPPRASATA
jgi:hypothetical protein